MGSGRPLVHGRRSKFLPKRLTDLYREALEDPNLVALEQDIALLDTLILRLLPQIESEEVADRVVDLIDRRRKLVRTEAMRVNQMARVMTPQEGQAFLFLILSIVKEETDAATCKRIAQRIAREGLVA